VTDECLTFAAATTADKRDYAEIAVQGSPAGLETAKPEALLS
jgi:hypothetical protein